MKQLIDVVNFNPDASCLSSDKWLGALRGGEKSLLCAWLNLYVKYDKKVVLGFTGAAVADMKILNPEALELINAHTDIFESVLRPFSHDNSLLRTAYGFSANYETGRRVIAKEFSRVSNFFLSPEFMQTNEQIEFLSLNGVDGVFINPDRFKEEIKLKIPDRAYYVSGAFDSRLKCIVFKGELTAYYLKSVHFYDSALWNRQVCGYKDRMIFSWRDGESVFLLPDSINREKSWLESESKKIERLFLRESVEQIEFSMIAADDETHYRHYPIHSFAAWVKEFRMIGFLSRLQRLENRLNGFSEYEKLLWLMLINSDILSAVEKDSPVIKIIFNHGAKPEDYVIWRSERGCEGEEFLALLEDSRSDKNRKSYFESSDNAHIRKARARFKYLLNGGLL
jgi:hypothetical protein